jgi:GAF domain
MHPDREFALRAGEDVRAAALRLGRAHDKFVSSRSMASFVRQVVVGSWERCAAAGASPDGRRLPPVRMDADELDDYRARHPLAAALPVLRELLGERASDDGHIFAVADAAGILLWVQGHAGTLDRAGRMNFVGGAAWSESDAGTNALGTALAVGRPVQIFAGEHYNTVVHPWSCSAVPVRDPDSGQVLGIIDITGGASIASPYALALVRATARAVEAELAIRVAAADERARREYSGRRVPEGSAVVLVSPGGRLLAGTPGGRECFARAAADAEAPSSGTAGCLAAEAIGQAGHLMVHFSGSAGPCADVAGIRLTALGRDCALVEIDGRTLRLRPRHSEIVVILALAMKGAGEAGGGLSGPRLAVELSEADIHPVTLRAEMSRLRAMLGGGLLGSQPYALRRPVTSDFAAVLDLLAQGRVGEAVAAYSGPLLPDSEAPTIVDYRSMLEEQLRAEVLASTDAMVLRRWVSVAWGANDAEAWRALARQLPGGSPQRAAAAARGRALGADNDVTTITKICRPGSRHPGRMQRSGNPAVSSV